ncbi:MAG: hypothetical protein Q9184_006523, partial [Pyrenodesmia sp. 2 TL-2023]
MTLATRSSTWRRRDGFHGNEALLGTLETRNPCPSIKMKAEREDSQAYSKSRDSPASAREEKVGHNPEKLDEWWYGVDIWYILRLHAVIGPIYRTANHRGRFSKIDENIEAQDWMHRARRKRNAVSNESLSRELECPVAARLSPYPGQLRIASKEPYSHNLGKHTKYFTIGGVVLWTFDGRTFTYQFDTTYSGSPSTTDADSKEPQLEDGSTQLRFADVCKPVHFNDAYGHVTRHEGKMAEFLSLLASRMAPNDKEEGPELQWNQQLLMIYFKAQEKWMPELREMVVALGNGWWKWAMSGDMLQVIVHNIGGQSENTSIRHKASSDQSNVWNLPSADDTSPKSDVRRFRQIVSGIHSIHAHCMEHFQDKCPAFDQGKGQILQLVDAMVSLGASRNPPETLQKPPLTPETPDRKANYTECASKLSLEYDFRASFTWAFRDTFYGGVMQADQDSTWEFTSVEHVKPAGDEQAEPAGNEHAEPADQEVEPVDNEKPETGKTKLADKVVMVIRGDHEENDIIIDGTTDASFKLFVSQVLHDYDHHYMLIFRFDVLPEVTNTKAPGKYMHAYVYITSESFADANSTNIAFYAIEEGVPIPKKLLDSSKTKAWIHSISYKRHALDLTYGSLSKLRESEFSVDAPYSQEVLEHLRNLKTTSGRITLFFHTERLSHIDSFMEKIKNNRVRKPLYHYYHGDDNYTHPRVNWNSEKSLNDVPNFEYDAHNVFFSFDAWYIQQVYGMIWNEKYSISKIDALTRVERQVWVLQLNRLRRAEGQEALAEGEEAPADVKERVHSHRTYVAFGKINDEEAATKCFDPGERFQLMYFHPDDDSDQAKKAKARKQWEGQVIPQIPALDHAPGNITFLLRRPNNPQFDDIELNGDIAHDMKYETMYFIPENSDLSAKCMINAANTVATGKGPKFEDLRRILQGQLPIHGESFSFLENVTEDAQVEINKIIGTLNDAQQDALERIRKKNTFAHILGPPGSGKSYFISKMVQMGALAGETVMVTGPNNPSVDNVAGTINADAPHLEALRLHSMPFENRAAAIEARRHTRKDKPEEDPETSNQQDADEEDADHEKRQLYTELVQYALSLSGHNKRARPNFKSMSLMARVRQRCGLDGSDKFDDKIEVVTRFRKVFNDGPDGDYGEKGYKKTFDDALEAIQARVISDSKVVCCTMSMAADNFLRKYVRPTYGVSDEVASATELQMLVMLAHYTESMRFFLGVGDPNQLRAVVPSYKAKNEAGKMVNPHGEQYRKSFMERRKDLQDDIVMFDTTNRMTQGLEQPSSKTFYAGQLKFSADCQLTNRPLSQKFLRYMRTEHGLRITVPRLVLDVAHGISQKDNTGSRFNYYNIAAGVQEICGVLTHELFSPENICVAVPYRRQAFYWRTALLKARKIKHFKKFGLEKIRVSTIDSLQGGQAHLVVLDFVTGSTRDTGLGFMTDRRRLNHQVALTRSVHALMVIADLESAFIKPRETDESETGRIVELDDDAYDYQVEEGPKALQGVFEHFRGEKSVITVDKTSLPTDVVDFRAHEVFESEVQAQICHNCKQA